MSINRKYLMGSTVVVLSVLIILLESAKHFLFPSLGIVQSHLITLIFVIIIVSAVSFLMHKMNSMHHLQIHKKQLETARLGQALLMSEDRYRAVFEHSSSAIVLTDGETWRNVDFNRKACETLGYSHLEFAGITLKDYDVCPFQELKMRFERIALTGVAETYETKYRKKNGELLEVLVNVKILTIAAKKYFLSVSEDIGERKRIQTKAVEQYEFLNTLMETIPSPVFYKDRQGKYIGCNRAFEDFTGIGRQEIIGRDVYEISSREIADEYLKKDDELLDELLNDPVLQVYESKVRTKKLGLRDVVFSKAAFKDIKGNVAGIIGVILDITERKKAEVELQRSRDALIEHNRILVGWTSPEVLYNPDIEEIVTKITETVAQIIKVDRVSIWLFNTDSSKLYCMELFEEHLARRPDERELDVLRYPSYFNALEKERVIVSNNPLSDPRYAELLDTYVKPHGISSTLDVPIFVAGEIIGVICIEHKGKQRDWTLEEQNFAISVGNIFSLALEISRHKKLEKSIQSVKDNFVNVVEKLPYPVLIIDMKGTVKYVNTTCERFFGPKVKDMLGSQFPYPLPGDNERRIDFILPDGSGRKAEIACVHTRWDREPARLISLEVPFINEHDAK